MDKFGISTNLCLLSINIQENIQRSTDDDDDDWRLDNYTQYLSKAFQKC